ncbi:uncharacterized protein LOC129596770 [Paramacrobiotus metropolitanus]|uniref:uncharacterized protein LOC129596770 n=1 Tax=Paramacrobiotus metropolitanus TaxID=2943436 RepID=UPI002445F25D|nr:uncharacterized protein LOC129596770 [Paramacrobiotus metropolitanus]
MFCLSQNATTIVKRTERVPLLIPQEMDFPMRCVLAILIGVSLWFAYGVFQENFSRLQNTQTSQCRLNFISYHSSQLEDSWLRRIKEWQIDPCSVFPEQKREAEVWINYSTSTDFSRPDFSPPRNIFSFFRYKRSCDGGEVIVHVEPLAFLTRHPFFCSKEPIAGKPNGDYVVDKSYLLLDWDKRRNWIKKRALYFDLGASTFDNGAGGNSQQWIIEHYAKRGILFDSIFAWEALAMNALDVFKVIPQQYYHKYHWYNFPITAKVEDGRNPWTVLSNTAESEDFVVVKLDIDNPDIENALVEQIMNNETLSGLIDEFYFEHHVNVTPMWPYWGQSYDLFLKDTYSTFLKLRKTGIAAHGWV